MTTYIYQHLLSSSATISIKADSLVKADRILHVLVRNAENWSAIERKDTSLNTNKGWNCPDSPTGYCNYEQEDGSYDEDQCRYCGEPEERK